MPEDADLACIACDVDTVEARPFFVSGTSAVEHDGKACFSQITECMAVGMAMQVDLHVGVALKYGLQSLASTEGVQGIVVLEEGEVVGNDDFVRFWYRKERFFKLIF